MINNNPYNLPDRMPQKQTRIYTETGSHYRNDSIQNIPMFNPPSSRLMSSNMIMKRSTLNIEEVPNSFRSPPYYPAVKNEVKHYMQSPKNHNSSSCGSLNNFTPHASLIEGNVKNEKDMRESLGKALDYHEINQKIQVLRMAIKNNQKRIVELQRNANNSQFLPNFSKISDHPEISESAKADIYQQFATKCQQHCSESMKKLKEDISTVRQQIKSCLKSNELDRLLKELKTYEKIDSKQLHEVRNEPKLAKEMEQLKCQLDERIKKNHDFMISIVGRLEKQFHQGLSSPPYKSSGIKCTGTAILLRFVECFKVRKNHSTNLTPTKANGEIKITILDNTYYIDSEGYLLDKDQFYLVDSRGMQVRLEEKHIRLLREENVFV